LSLYRNKVFYVVVFCWQYFSFVKPKINNIMKNIISVIGFLFISVFAFAQEGAPPPPMNSNQQQPQEEVPAATDTESVPDANTPPPANRESGNDTYSAPSQAPSEERIKVYSGSHRGNNIVKEIEVRPTQSSSEQYTPPPQQVDTDLDSETPEEGTSDSENDGDSGN